MNIAGTELAAAVQADRNREAARRQQAQLAAPRARRRAALRGRR